MTAADMPVLEVRGLRAAYGDRLVLDGIDLALDGGDILGLLGGNGSGKSTLLKAVTGQMSLRGGSVAIDGIDLGRYPERAKARLGFAVDPADLPSMLTGRQFLELVGSLRGLALDAAVDDRLVERFAVRPWLDAVIGTCSFGTRAKLSILAAVMARPPLVILDETLNGLDPIVAWEVKAMIREHAGLGRQAFVIATHVVETVPTLCGTAVLLAEGRALRRWTRDELAASGATAGGFERAVMQVLRDPRAAQAAG